MFMQFYHGPSLKRALYCPNRTMGTSPSFDYGNSHPLHGPSHSPIRTITCTFAREANTWKQTHTQFPSKITYQVSAGSLSKCRGNWRHFCWHKSMEAIMQLFESILSLLLKKVRRWGGEGREGCRDSVSMHYGEKCTKVWLEILTERQGRNALLMVQNRSTCMGTYHCSKAWFSIAPISS